MKVPFFDLTAQYASIKNDIDSAIHSVVRGGYFVGGRPIKEFETSFAAQCGSHHCIGLGNATDGLFIALKALGVKPGDEVITPAWSWISSAEVISLAGAKPVFADVDPRYFTISVEAIKASITSKTRALIVVHLYGQMVDLEPIVNLCKERGIKLIEDCSHAHLAAYNGRIAGTSGDCGVFSFFPTKNLGAYGDAGCVITDSEPLAQNIRRWANHGGLIKDEHLFEATNSRLDTLQAAILKAKLPHLLQWNNARNRHAARYHKLLGDLKELTLPETRPGCIHIFHQYVIQTAQRDALQHFLTQHEIQTLIHYPKAIPFEPAYQHLNFSEHDFPISSRLQNEVLSLPIFPELTPDQIEYVCDHIHKFYGK